MREGASLETGELHPGAGKKRRSKRRRGASYKSGCRVEGTRHASEPGEEKCAGPGSGGGGVGLGRSFPRGLGAGQDGTCLLRFPCAADGEERL